MTDTKGSTSLGPDIHALQKEWDEISCSICMEHPHNAVLLICSSHEKGCRSYICDTSYRHSNCLDRFKKLKVEHSRDHHHSHSISPFHEHPVTVTERFSPRIPHPHTSEQSSGSPRMRTIVNTHEHNHSLRHRRLEGQAEESVNLGEYRVRHTLEQNSLRCPLCRGTVTGWRVIKDARQYLDLKPRSCSRESCLFSGNYGELRRHARSDHPTTRPADVDPSRQRAWRHLEHQREYGDILSAIRSAMPGAVMFGDYMINDDEDVFSHDRELGSDTGPWWATLFLFHMMSGSIGSRDEFGGSSRSWRVRRRPSSLNRYLWGENLLGLQDDDDDDEIVMTRRRRRVTRLDENSFSRLQDDQDDDEEMPRRQRRSTRSRPDGDRP